MTCWRRSRSWYVELLFGHNVIIYFHDVSNKILSRNSIYIVDFIKCGNSSISMRKVYDQNLIKIWPEKPNFFFERERGGLGTNSIIWD